MTTRTMQDLIDLSQRVRAHLETRVWAQEVQDRADADWEAWKVDPVSYEAETNIYAYSRTYRWIMSWTRRRRVVAAALAASLRGVGVTPDMLEER